jgi:hypothetical protein
MINAPAMAAKGRCCEQGKHRHGVSEYELQREHADEEADERIGRQTVTQPGEAVDDLPAAHRGNERRCRDQRHHGRDQELVRVQIEKREVRDQRQNDQMPRREAACPDSDRPESREKQRIPGIDLEVEAEDGPGGPGRRKANRRCREHRRAQQSSGQRGADAPDEDGLRLVAAEVIHLSDQCDTTAEGSRGDQPERLGKCRMVAELEEGTTRDNRPQSPRRWQGRGQHAGSLPSSRRSG